jgi:hypothetical protein
LANSIIGYGGLFVWVWGVIAFFAKDVNWWIYIVGGLAMTILATLSEGARHDPVKDEIAAKMMDAQTTEESIEDFIDDFVEEMKGDTDGN